MFAKITSFLMIALFSAHIVTPSILEGRSKSHDCSTEKKKKKKQKTESAPPTKPKGCGCGGK